MGQDMDDNGTGLRNCRVKKSVQKGGKRRDS